MFYTFRVIGDNIYECSKWDCDRSHPLDTFEIRWRRGVISATMCSCPARIPCRHLKMIAELIESGCIHSAWEWYWQLDEWYTAYDQQKWLLNEYPEYTTPLTHEFGSSPTLGRSVGR